MNISLFRLVFGVLISIFSVDTFAQFKTLTPSEFRNLSLESFAKEGHGGRSVVCRDQENKIISAELFDFFEAPILYGQVINHNNEEIEAQVEKISVKLETALSRSGMYSSNFKNIRSIIRFTPENVHLKPVDDSLEAVELPAGCKNEQLAVYVDRNLILVDKEIWDELSLTDKAGLIVHEGIYAELRWFNEKDSRRTRKVVAHLFSNFQFINVFEGIPLTAYRCFGFANNDSHQAGDFDFFAFPEGDFTRLQFHQLAGSIVFSKKTIIIHRKHPFELNSNEKYYGESGTTESDFERGDHVGLLLKRGPDINPGQTTMKIQLVDADSGFDSGLVEFRCSPIKDEVPKI